MAPVQDLEIPPGVESRSRVVALARAAGEAGENVYLPDEARVRVQCERVLRDARAQFQKKRFLEAAQLEVGGDDFFLESLQLLGDVSLAVGDRLLADVI